ncbi:MAG: hypothetical protein FWE67_06870, partial [Planctomycetaceae bacterium]|nr:hypothetical protein [Planctomycetaceae bacterium]
MYRLFIICLTVLTLSCSSVFSAESSRQFRAGTAIVDITPEKLPIVIVGNFFPKPSDTIVDPLHARCLVLDDGKERIALVVLDLLGIQVETADEAKRLIEIETKIPRNRIMISGTHTHTGPGVPRRPAEGNYTAELLPKIAQGVATAVKNLAPAKVGWAVGNDSNNVYCRRFLMKEGTANTIQFGGKTNDRAQMNPGHANPNKIARTGPVDTAVSVLSVVSPDNKPIAVFANYSTHYAGVPGNVISADYFAVFAARIKEKIAEKIGAENVPASFLGGLSNSKSKDANCIDFLNPNRKFDYKSV